MKRLFIFCLLALATTCMFAEDANFVDLGLPSGVHWAERNEQGLYTFEQTAEQFTEREMPSRDDFTELLTLCTWTWNGSGYTVIGLNGDSIIFPMEKVYQCDTTLYEGDTPECIYWSEEAYDEYGRGLLISATEKGIVGCSKCFMLPVRRVLHPNPVFQRPDYEAIQHIKHKDYQYLLDRFQAIDTTLTISELQAIYYGSVFYGYSSGRYDEKQFTALWQAEDYQACANMLDDYLATSPVDLRAVLYRAILAGKSGETTIQKQCWTKWNMLVGAILVTGDGATDTTAIHVVTIADEYTLMRSALFYEVGNQALTATLCDKFDVITSSGRHKPFFFDVQLILALEERMFSIKKKPFRFHYNPALSVSH